MRSLDYPGLAQKEMHGTGSRTVQIRDQGPVGRQAPEDLVAEATSDGTEGLGIRVVGGHRLRDVGAAATLALERCGAIG